VRRCAFSSAKNALWPIARNVIGLFLHKPLFGDTLPVVCEEIAAQEGICVIPHPYRVISGALRDHAPELRNACFEIYQSQVQPGRNLQAQSLEQRGLIPVGGSDAHYRGDVGRCVNLVSLDGTPEDSVRQAQLGREPLSLLVRRKGSKLVYGGTFLQRIRAIPPRLRPVAAKVFHFMLNRLGGYQSELEVKHAGSNFEK
jgi:hypothetical protein